jgi:hypothetical protein
MVGAPHLCVDGLRTFGQAVWRHYAGQSRETD